MIGTTLHHYRIVRPLGRGGMGEVYAAEDTKLNRTVALKLLPRITAAGPERLKRFQREAQAIAALNHPNVVTIYSVEDAGGVPFITMELIEGKPLTAMIPRRGMKMGALLALARPLADAISAAHQRGIVHRDLKPSNIMVGDDGRLKVLDFGLAKLNLETTGDDGMGAANTATVEELTARHDIIGTTAYMSPEQAEGHTVDHRSDIFSVGILLYEMATGSRPFKGESAISILSSIIKDVPAAASQINPGVPPELERIIRRCLAKDPARRYQSALDLRNDLEEVADQSGAVLRVPAFLLAARRMRWIVPLAAIGLVAAAAAALWREPDAGRLPATFNKLTAMPGREWFPSLSPDGKWLVYGGENAGNLDIYLQSVSGSHPVNLTQDSAADDDMPAFSPDGEHIVFRSGREDGGLFVMGRTGEAVRRVTRSGFNPAWSPDGRQIAFATVRMDVNPQNQEGMSELWVVGVNGEEARRLHPGDALQPSWSPHKRRIAFAARRLGAARGADVWTIPVDGGPATAVTTDPSFDWNPIWSPDGHHLYFASDRSGTMNLWRIAIDEETGEPQGPPEPITTPAGFIAHPSISADGRRLVYSAVLIVTNIQRLVFDPAAAAVSGEPVWLTTGSRLWSNPEPSPDGQSVAFYSRVEPEGDLYVSRTDGTGQRQLTSDAALDRMPRWSPDGQWITCFSDRSGKLQVWKIRPDGSDLQQVTDDADPVAYGTWSPDSSRLAVGSVVGTPSATRGLYIIDPNKKWSEQQPDRLPPVPDSSQWSFTPNSWSLDGARLVGQLGLTPGVLTYTFKSRSYERLTDFGEWPVWLPDSRRVLFGDGGKNFWVVDVQTRQAKAIYSGGRDVLGPPRLTRDGRTAYYSRRVTESDIWLMTLK